MRGRPSGTFRNPWEDQDLPGVVLLDAQICFAPLRGVRVNERMAAAWAAAALKTEFNVSGPVSYVGAPPVEVASTGHRNSPRKRGLVNGYNELAFVHSISPRRTEDIHRTLADRLRKKRRRWLVRKETAEWLRKRSVDMACHLYPEIAAECRRHFQRSLP